MKSETSRRRIRPEASRQGSAAREETPIRSVGFFGFLMFLVFSCLRMSCIALVFRGVSRLLLACGGIGVEGRACRSGRQARACRKNCVGLSGVRRQGNKLAQVDWPFLSASRSRMPASGVARCRTSGPRVLGWDGSGGSVGGWGASRLGGEGTRGRSLRWHTSVVFGSRPRRGRRMPFAFSTRENHG